MNKLEQINNLKLEINLQIDKLNEIQRLIDEMPPFTNFDLLVELIKIRYNTKEKILYKQISLKYIEIDYTFDLIKELKY